METLDAYLERLASDAPAPGGGSASAVVAAAGAALTGMVARISARSPRNAPFARPLERITSSADELRIALNHQRTRDEEAFTAVLQAQALPKETESEKTFRRRALDDALERAADEPLRAAELCTEVLMLAGELVKLPANSLLSDVGCAAEFAYAGLAGCAYNVRVNHRFMRDATLVSQQEERLREYERQSATLVQRVRAKLR